MTVGTKHRKPGRPSSAVFGTFSACDVLSGLVVAWSDGAWAGDAPVVERARALAASDQPLPLSPTGPWVGAQASPPLRAAAAMLAALPSGAVAFAGDVPEDLAATAGVPEEAVA